MIKILNVLCLFFLLSCASKSDHCYQRRAAFDVGSGSTRVLIANVNICAKKVQEVLFKEEQGIPYRDTLQDGALSLETKAKGKQLIAGFLKKAKELKVQKILAVGTEVFRRATNGKAFVQELKQDLKFDLNIVDQEYEARLGYVSALSQLGSLPRDILVWDVGGASTQITYKNNEGFKYFFPKLGSVSFKESVISNIQRKDPLSVQSPNPLTAKQAIDAEQSNFAFIAAQLPEWLKSLLKRSGTKVLGIGGVHFYSVRGQLVSKKNSYNENDLALALKSRLNKTDKDIGGEFAATEVTNLVMIKSTMRALGIKEVEAVKANLTEGLLLQ